MEVVNVLIVGRSDLKQYLQSFLKPSNREEELTQTYTPCFLTGTLKNLETMSIPVKL